MSGPSQCFRVIALDDHPLVVEGMVAVLGRAEDLDVTWLGAAADIRGFTDLMSNLPAQERPDLALIDLVLQDAESGVSVIAPLVRAGVRCLAVTSETRWVPLSRAIQAGPQGVVLKTASADHFRMVVREVLAGEDVVTSEVAEALLNHGPRVELTAREQEVMRLIADGLPRKVVGRMTSQPIADSTVDSHVKNVLSKYRSVGRAEGNTISLLKELRDDGHL